ncbi:MAG: GTP-binding protein [Nitrospiraceae bacterium]|nr:MAG: GTP-binding protein [Nitrospiraceae bacterium]
MKTTIVCGVLGAGKTTFLNSILKQEKGKAVVLVNDFGSAGIDGEIISVGGIDTIELPSGCVCCTLRFDLITAIRKIQEQFRPDHLFIEPSGVASPSAVIDVLDTLGIQPVTVVGIVDATEFIEAYETDMYGWFFKSQVTRSDIILINKTDLVDEQRTSEIIGIVEMLNPNAVIVPAVNAELDAGLLRHDMRTPNKEGAQGHAFQAETITVLLKGIQRFDFLKAFFERMLSGEYGMLMRAKALVQTDRGPYRFDLASKQVAFEIFGKEVENSRLVVIGNDLKEEKIRKELER